TPNLDVVRGVVTAIEPKGQNLRNDVDKGEQYFKVHWVPFNPEEVERAIHQFGPGKCPHCGHNKTGVYVTQKIGRHVHRYRQCPKCKGAFRTAEFIVEILSKRRKLTK